MNVNNTKNTQSFLIFSTLAIIVFFGGRVGYGVGYILDRSRLTHRDRQAFTPNFESQIKLTCHWTVGVCREPTKAQEHMQTPHRKTPALQCSQTQDLLTPSVPVCQPAQKLILMKWFLSLLCVALPDQNLSAKLLQHRKTNRAKSKHSKNDTRRYFGH